MINVELLFTKTLITGLSLSRRENDFCIESSYDGINYKQMRIFHLFSANGTINIGIYACSPENSSFCAEFSGLEFMDCKWAKHK